MCEYSDWKSSKPGYTNSKFFQNSASIGPEDWTEVPPRRRYRFPVSIMYLRKSNGFNRGRPSQWTFSVILLMGIGRVSPKSSRIGWILSSAFLLLMFATFLITPQCATALPVPLASLKADFAMSTTWRHGTSARMDFNPWVWQWWLWGCANVLRRTKC